MFGKRKTHSPCSGSAKDYPNLSEYITRLSPATPIMKKEARLFAAPSSRDPSIDEGVFGLLGTREIRDRNRRARRAASQAPKRSPLNANPPRLRGDHPLFRRARTDRGSAYISCLIRDARGIKQIVFGSPVRLFFVCPPGREGSVS